MRKFFGDSEYALTLSPILIPELERKTGKGIGLLFRHVAHREYCFVDVKETIRLALIGGGISPETADALVTAYVATEGNPFIESEILAVEILSNLFAGEPQEDANE